jgi:hypothetical protein
MRKRIEKLTLSRETLREIGSEELEKARGKNAVPTANKEATCYCVDWTSVDTR